MGTGRVPCCVGPPRCGGGRRACRRPAAVSFHGVLAHEEGFADLAVAHEPEISNSRRVMPRRSRVVSAAANLGVGKT